MTIEAPWIVCQIGRREHYALAAGLQTRERLMCLFTDAWVRPKSIWHCLPGKQFGGRLRERYLPLLGRAPVEHFTASLIRLELTFRVASMQGWQTIIARNEWFQRKVVNRLSPMLLARRQDAPRPVVFAYSYAAREIFKVAKAAGCYTILGQIDPAILEEEIVAEAATKHAELAPGWKPAPAAYWRNWVEECSFADKIVVNSSWSANALIAKGIPENKLVIVPLAYQPSRTAINFERVYPPRFTEDRPLRVLFLGTLGLRKGLAELLTASRLLRDRPVTFTFVGPELIRIPEGDRANPRLHFLGTAPFSAAQDHYRDADLFILPTISDGFALTQIEAQSWGLPVIATRRCGEVVRDGKSGFVLDQVTPETIAGTLSWCIENPEELQRMSGVARGDCRSFSSDNIVDRLLALPVHMDRVDTPVPAAASDNETVDPVQA